MLWQLPASQEHPEAPSRGQGPRQECLSGILQGEMGLLELFSLPHSSGCPDVRIQLCSAGSGGATLPRPTENMDFILYVRLFGLNLAEFEGLITPGTGPIGVFSLCSLS